MKKRLIAVLCVIALVMGMFLVACQQQETATAPEKAEETGGYGEEPAETGGYGAEEPAETGGYGE